MVDLPPKKCRGCGNEFQPEHHSQRYCDMCQSKREATGQPRARESPGTDAAPGGFDVADRIAFSGTNAGAIDQALKSGRFKNKEEYVNFLIERDSLGPAAAVENARTSSPQGPKTPFGKAAVALDERIDFESKKQMLQTMGVNPDEANGLLRRAESEGKSFKQVISEILETQGMVETLKAMRSGNSDANSPVAQRLEAIERRFEDKDRAEDERRREEREEKRDERFMQMFEKLSERIDNVKKGAESDPEAKMLREKLGETTKALEDERMKNFEQRQAERDAAFNAKLDKIATIVASGGGGSGKTAFAEVKERLQESEDLKSLLGTGGDVELKTYGIKVLNRFLDVVEPKVDAYGDTLVQAVQMEKRQQAEKRAALMNAEVQEEVLRKRKTLEDEGVVDAPQQAPPEAAPQGNIQHAPEPQPRPPSSPSKRDSSGKFTAKPRPGAAEKSRASQPPAGREGV